ncbi:MAG: ABC transporter permease [Candidatus Omnitrophota bacterium]
MKGVWKLTFVEMKLFFREPMAAFFTLAFPLMMLLLFGGIYGNKPNYLLGGMGYIDTAIPALIALIIATSSMLTLPIQIATYRENKILRRLRATPLRPHAIIIAQVVNIFLMTTAGMVLLGIAGKLIFNATFPTHVVDMTLAYLFSCLTFFILGFVLASVFTSPRVAMSVAMAIFYPMIFLSGATIPFEILPYAIRPYSRALPLTQVVMLLRGVWRGEAFSAQIGPIIYLLIMFILGLFLTSRIFRWE